MPRHANPLPIYRRHRPSNQAVCTVRLANGQRKDLYLGKWNSPDSKIEFARVTALVSAGNGIYPDASDDLTINEAMVRYVRFVDGYYLNPPRVWG